MTDATAANSFLVLGVDPGLVCTGYGAIRVSGLRFSLVEAGVVRPDSDAPMPDRLRTLHDDIAALIGELQPDAMAIEEVFSHVQYPKTAIIMGHARGVLLLAAAMHNVPVLEYSPARIKQSVTGHGRATKESVARSIVSALKLTATPEPADVTDALAVALCHANAVGRPWLLPGAKPT
ncbi:MAG: crossover junction endodeoxyribonuclease RuvC [Planctomycetota bacterium]